MWVDNVLPSLVTVFLGILIALRPTSDIFWLLECFEEAKPVGRLYADLYRPLVRGVICVYIFDFTRTR